ncbi:MAG: cob(I)yrinic acid a,c-diamide adenosyltransferase [Desulfobacterales bacterium]
MKIYTGRGDTGTAGLLSGERISKSHERIEALGDIDELTSAIGIVRMAIRGEDEELGREMRAIQSNLIKLGAQIATWRDAPESEKYAGVGEADVRTLESAIDRIQEALPALEKFLLPFGHPAAVHAHMARSVCRRTERHVVRLSVQVSVGKPPKVLKWALIYLNRLSDYLFVAARYLNLRAGVPDDLWLETQA